MPAAATADEALAILQKEDHLPLIVVGVERYLALYQEVTKDPDAMISPIVVRIR